MKRKPDGEFAVSGRIRELAKQRGWPNPDDEVEAFVDHWEAVGWKRKGGILITDREAAFRTWLRNAMKWNKGKPVQPLAAAPKLDRPKPQEDLSPAEVRAGRERFSRFMAELKQVTAKKAIT